MYSISKKSTSMHSLSTDMVSRIEYDEKDQECLAKDEQIQVIFIDFVLVKNEMKFCFYLKILQAKIRRLEHLLHLKDIRVDDLAEKLDRTRGLPGAGAGGVGFTILYTSATLKTRASSLNFTVEPTFAPRSLS